MHLCGSWLLPFLFHVLLPLHPACDSAFLFLRALSFQMSSLYLLPSYWSFSLLLNQSRWHIFTQCNQLSLNRQGSPLSPLLFNIVIKVFYICKCVFLCVQSTCTCALHIHVYLYMEARRQPWGLFPGSPRLLWRKFFSLAWNTSIRLAWLSSKSPGMLLSLPPLLWDWKWVSHKQVLLNCFWRSNSVLAFARQVFYCRSHHSPSPSLVLGS